MSQETGIKILRKLVIDGLFLILLISVIIITSNLWVPYERGFFCGDQSLMFPYREDTVTVTMLRGFGLGLPVLAFLICEWVYLRKEGSKICLINVSVPVWLVGFYCVLTSFAFGACFIEITTNIAKNVIGRLRPHFFDICQPSIDCSLLEWQNRYILPQEYVCQGTRLDRFKDMHMSFISGHSSWSTFTMVYLALYLEKRMSWSGTRVVRHTLQFIAVMLSWFTMLSRVSDFKHHWSDVLAGHLMGLAFAVLVWTWGTDLLEPKPKHTPLPTSPHNHEITWIPNQQTSEPA
ncbi:putative phosphatidate phosphatase [Leptidea sinapis]|uniref:putative phosphatidate phosphatase n=1 Tax=Leptidea sinapis TaxID=189913 RepID=UPI0021C390E9|nr:putative phosphatidate phosphatase [Leptidea sinapis]